jgi:lipopolysaccharide biosynthesis glycosyltransferase
LISGRQWLGKRLHQKLIDALLEHDRHCPYRHDLHGLYPGGCKGADQCAFNIVAEFDWTPLDFRWNAQKPIRHVSTWTNAFLRHYTGPNKLLVASARTRDGIEQGVLLAIERVVGIRARKRRR